MTSAECRARHARGRCYQCESDPAPGRQCCPYHLKMNSNSRARFYRDKRDAGLCGYGPCQTKTLKSYCPVHMALIQARKKARAG